MGTILVVNDRESEREQLATVLRASGHATLSAGAGDAIERMRKARPDLVVLDIEFPGGGDLLARVNDGGATPVICCTQPRHVAQAQRLMSAARCSTVLCKPVEPRTLLDAVTAALGPDGGEPRPAPPLSSSGYFGATLPRYLENLDLLSQRIQERMHQAIEAPGASIAVGSAARSITTFNARLSALLQLNVALSSERDPDRMLELFCRRARVIMNCRYATIGVLDAGGAHHLAVAGCGLDATQLDKIRRSDPAGTVLGAMVSATEPVRSSAEPDAVTTLGLPPFLPPVRSLLVAPVAIRSAQSLGGWLYFGDKEQAAAFDDDDAQLAATMAAQLVLAYGNLTLYEEVQRHASAVELEMAEHRMTAQALSESEQRFRQIATHVESVFFLIDTDGTRVHYVSPAYEKLWGRTCASLYEQPKTLLESIHPDDRQEARQALVERSVAGQKLDIEFRLLRADGSISWIHMRSFPIHDGSRKAYRTAAVAVDISVEKRALGDLQESNRRFHELLDNVELVSLTLDREARITYCNEYLVRLTGWTRDELIGRNAIDLLVPPERSDVPDRYRDVLSGGTDNLHPEVPILTRSGERRLIRWNNTVLRNAQGETIGAASIGEDVTEQRRAQDELAYSQTHDLTTGLPRFSQVEEFLQSALAEAAAREGRVIVAYVDADRFHTINETRGRAVGDHVLRVLARRLGESGGANRRVAHVAGDEFAIVLRDPALAHDQFEFGESIRMSIEEPIEYEGRNMYVTCSVGVSCFPDNGSSPQELLRQAESAMLKAKHEGGNTVFAFANEHKQELEDRHTLGMRLDDALRNGEFLLHYQPRISGQDWRICGFEALLRWQSPEFGLLSPKRFHEVAEDLGMMVDIGSYVLNAACRQARSWLDRGADDFSISINVSPMQMQRANFVDVVRAALHEARLPARYLELELTEGMTTGNFERIIGTMRSLKALGLKLSLDDFGTGYSSLNYLRKFPIDTLKIDQSFVHDISTDVGATGVCRAIIMLAHQLGMTVVAEGVETAAQVGYLRRNDCDFFQGFYFCKAISSAKAFEILQHRYLPHEGLEQSNVTQPTLLLVDDEENILNALTRMLRRDGYRILTAKGAEEGLDILARSDVQVILSDQRMPGASGTEFLSKVKDMYPDTVRMVLSGYTELAAVTAAINQGAIYKFITKPWNDEELRLQIRDAFRIANRPNEQRKRDAN